MSTRHKYLVTVVAQPLTCSLEDARRGRAPVDPAMELFTTTPEAAIYHAGRLAYNRILLGRVQVISLVDDAVILDWHHEAESLCHNMGVGGESFFNRTGIIWPVDEEGDVVEPVAKLFLSGAQQTPVYDPTTGEGLDMMYQAATRERVEYARGEDDE